MAIVELITAVAIGALVMEGPHWYAPEQSLYFVDISLGELFCYDTVLDRQFKATVEGLEGRKIGFITPVEGQPHTFVAGISNRLELIYWAKNSTKATWLETLQTFDTALNDTTRFNDGKSDRTGRIYAGTMIDENFGSPQPVGSLYRYAPTTRDLGLLKANVTISNGLTWNNITNKFYYIDSPTHTILEYDWDAITGSIYNQRLLKSFRINGESPGFEPDGMTIDENGDLWVATWGGGRVFKINGTSGDTLDEIEIPGVPQVTSVAFGGPNLDELYVTTAGVGGLPPPSGGLFRIRELGVRGVEMYNARV